MTNPYQPQDLNSTLDLPKRTPLPKPIEAILVWGAFSYPLLLLCAMYATWLLAYIELGAAPQPNINDPKGIDSLNATYASEVTLSLLVAAPAAAVGGILAQFIVFRRSFERRMTFAAVLILLWIACFFLVRYEPLQIVNWLLD